MKIGVLGSGVVGETLANGFLKLGHEVMRGSRSPEKMASWAAQAKGRVSTGSFADAAKFADIVVLAVKGSAAESVLSLCGPGNLDGKTVIDTSNPIADVPPQNGVINFFTDMNDSLMERLQRQVPKAHLVKCFSSVGSALMVNPDFGASKPSMFICGNDERSKANVKEILRQFGWETEDMGAVEAARAIEPLCMLWCIPGFRANQWSHAFKLLKPS